MTKRAYIHKTLSPKVKEFQAASRSAHKLQVCHIVDKHRDILIDAMLCYFHTLSNPNDILLQTKGAASSIARFTLYTLLREYGHTLASISYSLNRSPATIIQGIENFEKTIIDNPDTLTYTNSYMQKHADIPKLALLHALKQLRLFNDELKEEIHGDQDSAQTESY